MNSKRCKGNSGNYIDRMFILISKTRISYHSAGFSFKEIGCLHSSKSKVLSTHFSSVGNILAFAGHEKKVIRCDQFSKQFIHSESLPRCSPCVQNLLLSMMTGFHLGPGNFGLCYYRRGSFTSHHRCSVQTRFNYICNIFL